MRVLRSPMLATAFAVLATGAFTSAQTNQLNPQKVQGPVGKVHYDLGTGKVTKLIRPGQEQPGSAETSGTQIGGPKHLVRVFSNTITTGYFTSGTLGAEFVDWAANTAGAGIMDAFIFGYATTARDTTAGGPGAKLCLSFYSGTTGFCTLGNEFARAQFCGLPGATASVPPGFGVGFCVTAFLAPPLICIPSGQIGWGYCMKDSDGSGGSLTGPLLTDFGTNTGWNDAFDFWAQCPASTGTCAGAFFFGGCLTGMVPPPPTGTPCASFKFGLIYHVPLIAASCTFRGGVTGCNPADLVVISNPVIGGTFKALTAAPFAAYAATVGPFPFPFKLAGTVKGELLCDPSILIGGLQVTSTGTICIPIPKDSTLDGFAFCIQAAEFLGPGCFQLTNAFDCVIGG